MQYESVKISDLRPAEYNPRSISERELSKLTESIRVFGFVDPVIVNADNTVIGGHQRIKAGERLGMAEVPCIRVDVPKDRERALNLALNRISGEWDMDLLAKLLSELDTESRRLSGFDESEITEALNRLLKQTVEDEYDPVLPENPKTKLGDVYQIGEHRLLCGDATNPDCFTRLLDGMKADMCFTDPPYNMGYMGGSGKRRKEIANDNMPREAFLLFLRKVMANLVSNVSGAFYVCMSYGELHSLWQSFTEAGGHWQGYIVWAKQRFTLGGSDYQHQSEPIMHGLSAEDSAKLQEPDADSEALPILYGWTRHAWYGGRKQGDVWFFDRPMKSPEHPTMKPVRLCAKAIVNSCPMGGIVLDAFGGSGSTLIAAEQVERRCFMIEMDPAYCDVIVDRWEKFTGKKASKIE
ncbi:MAG: site-specific DNA-methyltransferase [Patescibacteria group bacterium]